MEEQLRRNNIIIQVNIDKYNRMYAHHDGIDSSNNIVNTMVYRTIHTAYQVMVIMILVLFRLVYHMTLLLFRSVCQVLSSVI